MSTELAVVRGHKGDVMIVTELGIGRDLGAGLQLTPDGSHVGCTVLARAQVKELHDVLGDWLRGELPATGGPK